MADTEYMSVRMAHMHFAHAPGHVAWREHDLDALLDAVSMHRIHIVDPDRHPYALIGGFAVRRVAERRRVAALAASALRALAQENFAGARTHAAEGRRVAPVPAFLPAQLLEPGE